MAHAASDPTEQRLHSMAFRRLNSLTVVAGTFCYPYYSTDAAPGLVGCGAPVRPCNGPMCGIRVWNWAKTAMNAGLGSNRSGRSTTI